VRFFFSLPVNDTVSEQVVLDWLQAHQATVELTGYVSGND
jgi:D-methionine transport system ATP-binding protein